MRPYWSTHFMLPGQEHPHAQAVGEALENAREGLALLAGCEPFEVVFTGGGTESNNLAILGTLSRKEPGHVLVSALEHDSVQGMRSRVWPWPDGISRRSRVARAVWSIPSSSDHASAMKRVWSAFSSPIPYSERSNRYEKSPTSVTIGGCPFTAMLCRRLAKCQSMFASSERTRSRSVVISFTGPKEAAQSMYAGGLHLSPVSYGEPREMGLRPGAENVPACIGLGAAATLAAKCAEDASSTLFDLREIDLIRGF